MHGIPHLVWWNRPEQRLVEYGSSFAALRTAGLARSLRDTIVNLNERHLSKQAETVYEALEVRAAKLEAGLAPHGTVQRVGAMLTLFMRAAPVRNLSDAQAAKLEFNAVPYKGDADVIQAVRGGQVDFGSVTLSSAARSGLRLLGLFGKVRNPEALPLPSIFLRNTPYGI